MSILSHVGLRARLAIALVSVAVLAVGLATYLSNRGLHPRVTASAEARLDRSAVHFAEIAAGVYRENRGWTPEAKRTLGHLADLDGLRFRLNGTLPGPAATADVVVAGKTVGTIAVAPSGAGLLRPEDETLQSSVNRLHIVAGTVSALVALLLAFVLAETLSRPLRRIRQAARRMEAGDLATRVRPGGDAEVRAVGHALNQLAETLEHEEDVRRSSVADLAHELRTPVSALLSRIEAAQDGVLEDEPANLEAMHAETLRLARLLDDLARLADAERPGFLIEKRTVDLAITGRQQADVFAPLFTTKAIAFSAHLEPAPVRGDADRLGQVVSNLLANALRYTEPGGRVELRVRPEGGSGLLEVSDTGIGIAPADIKHVFVRFWRGEKSRSRTTGGAGIGLAIVHELVRAHDGRIEVESGPRAGSTFRVWLPLVSTASLHANGRATSRDLQMPARP